MRSNAYIHRNPINYAQISTMMHELSDRTCLSDKTDEKLR